MNATGHRFAKGRCVGCDSEADSRQGRMRCVGAVVANGSLLRHRHTHALAGRLIHPDDVHRTVEFPVVTVKCPECLGRRFVYFGAGLSGPCRTCLGNGTVTPKRAAEYRERKAQRETEAVVRVKPALNWPDLTAVWILLGFIAACVVLHAVGLL